ncbi:MAG TPA: bifunctional (p)ppGpp synthetase/guanosine-3',5'-bis(diphosphate) 3'-pyrophosphohydrolase [Terriglobales bacterium]|nr:bifunctional (p)ppGpp synthetase/guanosine-3',5'-bis(diphosphate) 3'-pyrophosphohydrolase [Terriglobales bacterium]
MATLRQQIATNVLTVTRFRDLLRKIRTYRPHEDLAPIKKAYEFSQQHHKGQARESGEPYLVHPLQVATILAEMQLDTTAIVAGLLHDAVEDTAVTSGEIETEFGEQVAHIVEGVTKISKIDFASSEEAQAENVRKMVLAMMDDIRVVLIKLADRLHNMRTLKFLSPERQKKIARETLDIYAPIAHRLGMGKIRGELEDLAFQYVDPIAYEQVRSAIEQRRKEGEAFLAEVQEVIEQKLKENKIQARVEARIKRFYSIWQKLQRQRISVDQIYDMLALRIITKAESDCYAVLGLIHNQWRPVPGRIKDFIAIPRNNFYKSLHTTVISEKGHAFEVQIRTEEMHKMAEEGIAAHWKYKDGPVSARDEQRLAWLRQVVEWQRDIKNSKEFLSTLKIDLYPEEVYTFTPKGRIVILPRDATPVDFAYSVHTEVGHSCVGAKVNGRIVALRYKLRSGDIVEIQTQPGHNPSRDWLQFTKSSRARQKIKHWLNLHQRERAIEIGRKLIEKEARKYRIALKSLNDEDMMRVSNENGLAKPDDLLAAIGYGKFSARSILARLVPAEEAQSFSGHAPPAQPSEDNGNGGFTSVVRRVFGGDSSAIKVKGHDDLLVYRAGCCNPIRGEEIIGYVTRGKGVAVHSKACANIDNLMFEPERQIAVEWARDASPSPTWQRGYPVKLTMACDNRPGMVKAIATIISDANTNIRNMDAKTVEDNATVEIVVDIADLKHLERILTGVRKLPGVRDVQRVQKL